MRGYPVVPLTRCGSRGLSPLPAREPSPTAVRFPSRAHGSSLARTRCDQSVRHASPHGDAPEAHASGRSLSVAPAGAAGVDLAVDPPSLALGRSRAHARGPRLQASPWGRLHGVCWRGRSENPLVLHAFHWHLLYCNLAFHSIG